MMAQRSSLLNAFAGIPHLLMLGVVTALLVSTGSTLAEQPKGTYSRKASFGAVLVSRDDLIDLFSKTYRIISAANQGAKADPIVSFEVGDGVTTLTLNNFPDHSVRFPTVVSYQASLLYFDRHGTPISKVAVRLRDFSREIEIAGADSEQVELLFAFLSQELSRHTTLLSGPLCRFIASWLGATLFVFMGLGVIPTNLGPNGRGVLLLLAVILALFLPLLPVAEVWLPGTAIYTGDASFVVRNAAWISFLGVLMTPLLTAIAMWYARHLATRSSGER